ncbi:TIGR03936 family radical SAM-associated protein [uncultured Ilyobacter sp.]|uniref:TIGR03936 family radical SAM-associated protein n=1 Tax=uncultured Ilyobacter sp. TaxID=544433 RepID=UPI0029C05768|nr:TIGR03936 family radical SAM-associated protein [uncultured Ilyobacter sp.]
MKKRLYFDKIEDMKYISHLDMMRFLERLLKKAKIEVKYSEGFHPRPKMSFGNPVSLGVEAYDEVMDLELLVEMDNKVLLEKLNAECPRGFRFKGAEDVPRKSSIAEEFQIMIYEISGDDATLEKLKKLLEQNEIVEVKIKKGKRKERNLKERIQYYKMEGDKLRLELINTSPNVFLGMAEVNPTEVEIKKLGYRK